MQSIARESDSTDDEFYDAEGWENFGLFQSNGLVFCFTDRDEQSLEDLSEGESKIDTECEFRVN